jgi:hypothetical protein
MYYLRDLCPLEVRRKLYTGLAEAHLSYGLTVWGGTYSSTLKQILVTQKFIVRSILRKKRREHSWPLFLQLNLLPLRHLFIFKTLRTFYNRSGNCQPTLPPHNTRNRNKKTVPKPATTAFKKTFHYIAPKLFNLIPDELKTKFNNTAIKRWLQGEGKKMIEEL